MLQNPPAASTPDNLTSRQSAQMARLLDYSSVQSIGEIWPKAAQKFGDTIALKDPHAKPQVILTYTQLSQQIRQFAAGLQAMGVQPGDRISLFADNSPRWFVADQGIITAGAVDAVRSSQADRDELLFIIANSGSTALVVEDRKTLNKLRPHLDDLPLQLIVLLFDSQPEASETLKTVNFLEVIEKGASYQFQPVTQNRDTLATLIYTSGTTGKPKGVMLSHGNLLHQVTTFGTVLQPQVGDIILSILPSWHSYERTVEYYLLSQGCTQIYTNLRHVKSDLKEFKPKYMVGVPRLWESIYEGIQKQFREQPPKKQRLINTLLSISQRYIELRRVLQGLSLIDLNPSIFKRLSASIQVLILAPLHFLAEIIVYRKIREATGGKIQQLISGGGSLAKHLETFFEIIGIEILVGYGLTETSPVTNVRRVGHNLRGSSGPPMPETEIKIVSLETGEVLPAGERGKVLIRGPQVMLGYYQNPSATQAAIDAEGWFDSGDLGWVTPQNDLVLTGRAKDTIVLTNGENIEPQPIEDACLRSPYIDQIVLVGQDRRSLGALIVPNLEALHKWAVSQNLRLRLPESVPNSQSLEESQTALPEIDFESKMVQELFRQELNREVQNRPGYRPDDRIGPYKLILEPFSVENGMMTQTLKIRRPVVMERYRDTIDKMFEK